MRTLSVSAVAVLLAVASASALEIKLTVQEPAGLARTAEPISGGIPLPEDQFKADQPFAIFDDAGKEVPAQVIPMVVNTQGFIRWVLVDFQADLPAKGTRTFVLKDVKPAAAPTKALNVNKTADGVTIDTGVASVVISASKPFGLFDSASAAGKPVLTGGQVRYTDGFTGKTFTADKPRSIEVEYVGPMRATVCVRGSFVGDDANKFQYVARITAWAGKSEMLVKYSLSNSNPDHYCYRSVRDSSIELKLAAAGDGGTVGAAKPIDARQAVLHQSARVVSAAAHTSDALGEAGWLRDLKGTKGPGGCVATSEGKQLWASDKADQSEGWIAVKTAAGGSVFVSDLYFVEDPPRKLAFDANSIVLSGIAEPIEGQGPFPSQYRWLFDCSHLSSQYLLDLAAPADKLSETSRRGRSRLWAMAEPAWYFQTEQLPVGKFGTQADELKCYDTWGWKYDGKDVPKNAADKLARMPRWSGGDDNHFTSEQDTADALILMYLRTGQRSFFDGAEGWINYFTDLQTWRTDGWQWKDGGGWWAKRGKGGPLGNRPVRAADPVTGVRNYVLKAYAGEEPFGKDARTEFFFLANAKACHCHNWGEGLVEWFMITGDRDAFDAAIDTVENHYDTQINAFAKAPGKPAAFSRDFTRASYLTNATRLIAPADPLVIKASDELAAVYLKRPNREPRGLVNSAGPSALTLDAVKGLVGQPGIDEMNKLGVTLDEKTGQLTDPKTGAKWYPLNSPHTWMYPPLSRAMELYYRETGNEDALDWLIAYGQGVAHVLFQPKHGNLDYGAMLADFPLKGVVKDRASWLLPDNCVNGEGVGPDEKPVVVNGYLASFYPDVPARAYTYCGEEFLKQRAFDYWYWCSHRAGTKMANIGRVGTWVNVYSTHNEHVCFTGRTFYEWAHPRADTQAPAAVENLSVTVNGEKATVSFTSPAERGGGRVVRYQVKCADKLIFDYASFLRAFAKNEDSACCNWWMAANLAGEPAPGKPGQKVSFEVTGVPAGAKFFAVRTFDDSNNRSAISNVVEAR